MPQKKTESVSLATQLPVPVELIERRIYLIRGHKVMLDSDLADLYQVETRTLVQAVKRNRDRFPGDFMFQLTKEEAQSLTSQFVISNVGRGGRRYLPYVFTEHGVGMLSAVLKSQRAVQMSIMIVRAFVRMRELLATHKDLASKIDELEREQKAQGSKIDAVYTVVKRMIDAPQKPKRPIGFKTDARS